VVVTTPVLLGPSPFTPTQLFEFLGVLVIGVDDRAPPLRLGRPRPMTVLGCIRIVLQMLGLMSVSAS
jgi:hypothetical protein